MVMLELKAWGVLLTTFGVGELSALNGIASSYAEHVGVLHIVGVPSTISQAKNLLLHHTLDNGDFDVFHRISAEISETTEIIIDPAKACDQIDRCIRTTYIKQRTVYLSIPANFFDIEVSADRLNTPIILSLPKNDPEAETEVIETIISMVKNAKNPVIISDACASRHDCKEETKKLIDITQFPAFTTPMGKGSIDETHLRYSGVYVGTLSAPDIKKCVESADLVLSVGALLSDFNTGSFSYSYHTKNIIEFHSDHIKIKNAIFVGVQMKPLLQKLLPLIPAVVQKSQPIPVPSRPILAGAEVNDPSAALSQNWL